MDPTLFCLCVILVIGVGAMLVARSVSTGVICVSILAMLMGGAERLFGMMLSGFDNPRQGAQMQRDGRIIAVSGAACIAVALIQKTTSKANKGQ